MIKTTKIAEQATVITHGGIFHSDEVLATFCHPAGFIGGADTFEDAYALAKIAVEA